MPGAGGGAFQEPPSNISNPDSESGYSSFGGDTPSSGKSHSPVTSGSSALQGSLALLQQQQKDIKPDINQLRMLTMMNGGGGGQGGGGMSDFFNSINGELNHHHHHHHPHMNGINMNGHGGGGGSHGNAMLHNGHNNGTGNGHHYSNHPPVQDPFTMAPLSQDFVDSLGGGGGSTSSMSPPTPSPMSQTTSPHSSNGGHTPIMISPTSTQMSPQMSSSSTPPALIPKPEPLGWSDRPTCMSHAQQPPISDDPTVWVKQVRFGENVYLPDWMEKINTHSNVNRYWYYFQLVHPSWCHCMM